MENHRNIARPRHHSSASLSPTPQQLGARGSGSHSHHRAHSVGATSHPSAHHNPERPISSDGHRHDMASSMLPPPFLRKPRPPQPTAYSAGYAQQPAPAAPEYSPCRPVQAPATPSYVPAYHFGQSPAVGSWQQQYQSYGPTPVPSVGGYQAPQQPVYTEDNSHKYQPPQQPLYAPPSPSIPAHLSSPLTSPAPPPMTASPHYSPLSPPSPATSASHGYYPQQQPFSPTSSYLSPSPASPPPSYTAYSPYGPPSAGFAHGQPDPYAKPRFQGQQHSGYSQQQPPQQPYGFSPHPAQYAVELSAPAFVAELPADELLRKSSPPPVPSKTAIGFQRHSVGLPTGLASASNPPSPPRAPKLDHHKRLSSGNVTLDADGTAGPRKLFDGAGDDTLGDLTDELEGMLRTTKLTDTGPGMESAGFSVTVTAPLRLRGQDATAGKGGSGYGEEESTEDLENRTNSSVHLFHQRLWSSPPV